MSTILQPRVEEMVRIDHVQDEYGYRRVGYDVWLWTGLVYEKLGRLMTDDDMRCGEARALLRRFLEQVKDAQE